MDVRKNAGYIITNSLWVGNIELVLGQSETTPNRFVTWQCTGGNYYWGHYFSHRLLAEKDLYKRAIEKIEDFELAHPAIAPGIQKSRGYER